MVLERSLKRSLLLVGLFWQWVDFDIFESYMVEMLCCTCGSIKYQDASSLRSVVKPAVWVAAAVIHIVPGGHQSHMAFSVNHSPVSLSCAAYCLSHEFLPERFRSFTLAVIQVTFNFDLKNEF